MAGPARTRARHLAGLAFAVLLGAATAGLWLVLPGVLRGTILQRVGIIVLFLSILALLTLAERLWTALTRRPEK